MSIKINKTVALQVLEEETKKAKDPEAPAPQEWLKSTQELWALCKLNSKTCIAALGTACLAKAIDIGTDATALKVRLGTPNAYSARSLGHDVLAAHALRLGIDLGVTGREPLNNQPFLRADKITRDLISKAPDAIEKLVTVLEELNEVRTQKEARLILRAFLRARLKKDDLIDLQALTSLIGFTSRVEAFVLEESEHGRRAQAVVAGLLDVVFPEQVATGHVHDPDRRFPGDVAVLHHDGSILTSVEVRDKPVKNEDLYHLVRKAIDCEVTKAICIAVSAQQGHLEIADPVRWAEVRGVMLRVFVDWDSFVGNALLWSKMDFEKATRIAHQRIFERLKEVEASAEALMSWNS